MTKEGYDAELNTVGTKSIVREYYLLYVFKTVGVNLMLAAFFFIFYA